MRCYSVGIKVGMDSVQERSTYDVETGWSCAELVPFRVRRYFGNVLLHPGLTLASIDLGRDGYWEARILD